jgi:hypothetical protein
MRRGRPSPTLPSPNEPVSLVLGATLARNGGSSSARLINVANHLRTKKRLSADYRETNKSPSKGNRAPPLQVDHDLHQKAVDGVRHFLQHGDAGVLTKLATTLETAARRVAFISWCTKHLPISWHVKTRVFRKSHSGKCGTLSAAILDPIRLPVDPQLEQRKLRKLHEQAVTALQHAIDHGDWTAITGLVNAFFDERKGAQLASWFEAFGTFSYEAGRLRFSLRRPTSAVTISSAMRTPFFEIPVKSKRADKPDNCRKM